MNLLSSPPHDVLSKLPFILGLLALAGSTVLLYVGNIIGILLAGRVLQGFSAAVVDVVGLALIVDTVGPEAVGEAMGYVGLSMNLAILLGPMLGGLYMLLLGTTLYFHGVRADGTRHILATGNDREEKAARWLPTESAPLEHPLETLQEAKAEPVAPLLSTEVECNNTPGPESLPSTNAQARPSQKPLPHITVQWVEEPRRHLPRIFQLLSSRRVLTALWACIVKASLLTAFDSTLPLFVSSTFHWNSLGAGMIFLPMIVASLIVPIGGKVSDRFGPRWLTTAGFVAACPPLILLRLVHHDTLKQKVLLCVLLALFAAATTCVLTPLIAEIAYAVDAKVRRLLKQLLNS
ncbi:hypothetical protein DSL72_004308 [Monilinia vaccinii-corymbosi]|uniref:Major facilitator superfamily (MFS) profile domain-containing protein n=1 Tax=Monilinia vaccinii-corymbosi TaxID=61207 RepID=A0A8A3P4C7_9HELO|nr:hypothetical protein DSL72_004308 [Monilinia vaccinii-corymbosi]